MLRAILLVCALICCVCGFLGIPRFNWWYGVAGFLIAALYLA